jgi:tetratricopeptide (TPR) repeat protein
MNLSPRYNTSLSAISLVALPLLVAFASLSQVVLAQESGASLSLVAQVDRKAEADRLLEQGIAQRQISEYRNAIQFDLKALNICIEIKDLNCEGRALNGLGLAYVSLGHYQKAIDYHKQSLSIAKQIGALNGEQALLNNLGSAYYYLGQYQQAIDYHQQSLGMKNN